MFFNKKINPNQSFAWLLLIYFVASTLFLTVHSFSHHAAQGQSYQKVLNTSDQNNIEQCGLCDLFITQNQIFSFVAFAFAALSFSSATIFAFKKRLKLSTLFSSNSPRAPPYFS